MTDSMRAPGGRVREYWAGMCNVPPSAVDTKLLSIRSIAAVIRLCPGSAPVYPRSG